MVFKVSRKFVERTLGLHSSKQLKIYQNLAREMTGKLANTNKMIHGFKTNPNCARKLKEFLEEPLKDNGWKVRRAESIYEQLGKSSEAFKDIEPEILGNMILRGVSEGGVDFLTYQPGEIILSPEKDTRDAFYIVFSG